MMQVTERKYSVTVLRYDLQRDSVQFVPTCPVFAGPVTFYKMMTALLGYLDLLVLFLGAQNELVHCSYSFRFLQCKICSHSASIFPIFLALCSLLLPSFFRWQNQHSPSKDLHSGFQIVALYLQSANMISKYGNRGIKCFEHNIGKITEQLKHDRENLNSAIRKILSISVGP